MSGNFKLNLGNKDKFMRKGLGIIAVSLAAGCVFMAGCAGCNNKNKNISPLASNWYTSTGYRNIQPTFLEGNELYSPEYKEKIVYDVNFKKPAAGNSTYSVNYENGTYSTEFYAKQFDTENLVHSDHKGGYEGKKVIAYYYHTEFSAKVTFKYGSKESDPLVSNIVTDCYFLSVEEELRPLYSKQVVASPSPAALQAASLEDCYTLYNETYETYYSYDGNSAISKITDNETNKTREVKQGVGGTSNSLFDVTSLEIVLRALIGSSFDQTIDLYTPLNAIKTFTLSSPDTSLGKDEKKSIATALSKKGLYASDEIDEKFGSGLKTTAVSVTVNTTLKGVSQTYWFAKVENKRNNTGRATLLKISLPIVFNLGTLEYTLNEVQSTLWDE